VIGAIAILILGRIAVSIVTSIVKRLMEKTKVDETLGRFVTNLTRITLLIFIAIAALSTLGVETTSFIAVVGAAGLAVGLALQGSLSNFASGVLLIAGKGDEPGATVMVIMSKLRHSPIIESTLRLVNHICLPR